MNAALLAGLLLASSASAASFVETVSAAKFLKGCLHSHSNDHAERSYADGKGDGDSTPAQVLAAYQTLGYDFVALTDHNELTTPASSGPTALKGIELTSHYGPKKKPVHVGAVCVARDAKGLHAADAADALSATIASAQAAGAALIVVNHPAYAQALDRSALTSASGFNAIEIASGHPEVEKDDAAASRSAEDLWDDALGAGADVWAVAADDAHDFEGTLQPDEPALRSPGKAWVAAWADSSSENDLCSALKAGRFYSSTGPALKSLAVRANEISVAVAGSWNKKTDQIEFLKANGRVAAKSSASSAGYFCDGSEQYVRVRITQAGKRAWTQAYRVK